VGRSRGVSNERPSFKIDAQHPGSELAAERRRRLRRPRFIQGSDTAYANLLVTHAKQLYSFATYTAAYTAMP